LTDESEFDINEVLKGVLGVLKVEFNINRTKDCEVHKILFY
jgi:hypothetical protein